MDMAFILRLALEFLAGLCCNVILLGSMLLGTTLLSATFVSCGAPLLYFDAILIAESYLYF